MKIWAKTDGEVREGKYLVVRRDGTIPLWPHFVIGGDDYAGPAGLRAYAVEARRLGYDPEYCDSLTELADDFARRAVDTASWAAQSGTKGADPDAPPHRKDNPAIVAMMRGEGDLSDYKPNWFPGPLAHKDACELSVLFNRAAEARAPGYHRINAWLEKLIASASDNPENATGGPDGR